jgi:hypothetical protein
MSTDCQVKSISFGAATAGKQPHIEGGDGWRPPQSILATFDFQRSSEGVARSLGWQQENFGLTPGAFRLPSTHARSLGCQQGTSGSRPEL